MSSLRVRSVLVTAILTMSALASAQSSGMGRVVLRDGRSATTRLPPNALRVTSRDVSEASCRSCVGRHTTYELHATFPRGPVESVEIVADVVGARRAFTIGSGPYPARSDVRVRMRGATEDVSLGGTLAFETARSPLSTRVTYTARAPTSPVRSMLFDVRRSE